MKRPVKVGIGIVIAILVILFGIWFWSLGASASEDVPQVRVEVVHAPVEIQHGGTSDWTPVDVSTEVQNGDHIRTGADGAATIRWGDRGVSRLDPQSELTVDAAPDPTGATHAILKLDVTGGRAWTRLLKLLDVTSDAEVRTGTVVATVRGTAFGVAKTDTGAEVSVTESVVGVGAASGTPTLLPDNMFGAFSATGTPIIVRPLTDQDAWAVENRKKDATFDDAFRHEIEQRLQKLQKAAPEWLVEWSEELHLQLTDTASRDTVVSGYVARRIGRVLEAPSAAPQILGRTEGLIRTLQGDARDRVLLNVRDALFVVKPRPGFPPSTLFTKLASLRTILVATSPADAQYARALEIDDGIDQLLYPPSPITDQDAAQQASDLRDQIGSLENDAQALPDDQRTIITDKAHALRARLASFGILPPVEPLQVEAPTSTDMGTTSTIPTSFAPSPSAPTPSPVLAAPPATAQPPSSVSTSCGYRLTLFAKPSTVGVGQPVTMSLYGTCPDGTTVDLTALAQYSSSLSGSIGGNVYTPNRAGTATLTATYNDDGLTKTANASVTVTDQTISNALEGVRVSAVGSTTLSTGQSVPVQATAVYTGGQTTDVTYQCTWSTSNPRLADIFNQKMTSLSGTGNVDAYCSYTEGGITKIGTLGFTIVQDASLTPTYGNTKPTCVPNYQLGIYCP